MNNLETKRAILESLFDPSFVLKTQQQIIKDFAKVNLEFPVNFATENYSKDEIEVLIANEVATISERGERQLLQLLYAIDLSEKIFLELTQKPDFLPRISEQILLREAYKVWLRINYSK